MGKHKLIRISEKRLRNDARSAIIDFINERFLKNKITSLKDIQCEFQKPPFELAEGTIINYLNDLVERRKISTWKEKNRRFYGPPKIPIPIKTGLAVAVVIVMCSVLIDIFVSPEHIFSFVYLDIALENTGFPKSTMFPMMVYLLILTVLFTVFWYAQYRKEYK